ncbi:glycosyl hydrolase family 8 [Acuticoccus sediminis]|uniref:glycosyl hydrolase family 8 n=1 Tax=Acuticoccus sediminis TaxID=2184697 RepID=UPI001CFF0611|nr:glycosyl hydrolase family 8 [Acuticoccus sediminis]
MARTTSSLVRLVASIAVAATVFAAEATPARAAPQALITASAVSTTVTSAEWAAYRARFVHGDGRVVDVEKGGHTHSEGQGYGMLLAMRADDRETFDRIADFTFRRMRGRTDGLVSWLYHPQMSPRILDTNNASDGDILIAYALILAGLKWDDARYLAAAMPMVTAIGDRLLERRGGYVRVKPAAFGFDPGQHPGGAVVNLSYYVYGAFLAFEAVDDRHPWREAWQSGLMLTEASLAGDERLAPDWIALEAGAAPRPARGHAARSSYDAVRVPLYMALGGRVPARYFAPFDRSWNLRGHGIPKDYDIASGRVVAEMDEPGYRAIAGLAACAARGVPLPRAVQRFKPRTYYSSTLHLLALSAARAHYGGCAAPAVASAAGPDGGPRQVALAAPARLRLR